jgi:hypothetical protein
VAGLPRFLAIREKYGMAALDDAEHLESLVADERVLLTITPRRSAIDLDVLGPVTG